MVCGHEKRVSEERGEGQFAGRGFKGRGERFSSETLKRSRRDIAARIFFLSGTL
jgi:hypothetical protein